MIRSPMEVDHVPYIFGSFSRRRHSHNLSAMARRTEVTATTATQPCHAHSHSQPVVRSSPEPGGGAAAEVARPRRLPAAAGADAARYMCAYCEGLLLEPRVLACLHTFCTKCLLDIEQKEVWDAESVASANGKSESSSHGEDNRRNSKASSSTAAGGAAAECVLPCPVCGMRTPLHRQGVLGLPPHYMLQHRIVLATLHNESTKLLCDVCTSDVLATHRCTECLINLCELCTDKHRKQRLGTAARTHELLALKDARQKGAIRVQRQIMCQMHPDQQLMAYCSTCAQVVCRDCMRAAHASHECEPAARAALARTARLTHALQRARAVVDRATALSRRLHLYHSSVDGQCRRLEDEIDKFMDAYQKALQQHRKHLLQKVNEIREEKLQLISGRQQELERKMQDAKYTVQFAEELLSEDCNVELLTFLATVLRKLDLHSKMSTEDVPNISGNVHFLPNETIEYEGGVVPLYGAISTQTVAPDHCILVHKEDLDNLRVHRRADITLETRDSGSHPITYGGEVVTAELWYRDAGTSYRSLDVSVADNRNGTYTISFTPDTPGKLSLLVHVKGQHIKDSPFPIVVRNLRPHRGTYHCCNFCSSGGNKEATCACGGTMPGGYKGCGHGHEGHPGRRHWSCCGNVLENSECGRINSIMYQFTL